MMGNKEGQIIMESPRQEEKFQTGTIPFIVQPS